MSGPTVFMLILATFFGCVTAHGLRTGRTVSLWRTDLDRRIEPGWFRSHIILWASFAVWLALGAILMIARGQ